ncbi:hypothetical protein [Polyangium sp. 15x6]|uniref:hypothetical protein n=1 Tax=Polyangium sp. 15x6 TaxID=3042687 RepID=UPI00249BBB5F|nr:hypothetical protein [Polyangium sp. 15x6]MDI3282948.1 hypothetical protein [Polyangium sp. 15x6]
MTVSPPPVPPGKSPFHVRGSTYLGVRSYIDEQIPGGLPAVLAHVPDEAVRAFASQVFLPVAMYDVLPLRPITEATARAEGMSFEESVRGRARIVAQRDIRGLYKLFFKAVSPATAAERLQRASLRYFDFGELEILEKGAKRTLLAQKGMPRFLLPWYLPMIEGYTAVVLEIAGARSPTTRAEPPRRDGEREGLETVSLRIELAWS